MIGHAILRRVGILGAAALLAGCAAAVTSEDAPAPRQAPPPPMEMRPLEFPGFHQTTLGNGLDLVVVEYGTQPVANVALYVRSGDAAVPAAQAGLADLLASTLTKGTESRSALEIAELIEGVGGRLNAFSANDHIGVTATVLNRDLALAFDVVSDVALRPSFPDAELDTERRRTLSALQVQLGQPQAIAQRAFQRHVYGDHPYGSSPAPETVRALSRDDLAAFHARHFAPGNAFLLVSGQVRAGEVEALARRYFAPWSGGPATAEAVPEPPTRDAAGIYLIHRPGSAQSVIYVGHLALRPDDPDYHAAVVANNILGGGTDARLFMILREEKGWTYGSYSQITRPREMGHFRATAEVRTEVTDSALHELMHQIRRMREEPVSAQELDAAKGYLVGSFPISIQTPAQVASQIANRRILGLPVEDLLTYRERIAAITIEDVQRVAARVFRPDEAAIVVVGDATRILDQVEAVAPVALFDIEGNPLDLSALAVGDVPAWDGTRLRELTLVYDFSVQGNPMGTVTSTLSREAGDWLVVTSLQSPVLTQESEHRFTDSTLEPVSSRLQMTQGGMSITSDLVFEDGRIRGEAKLPPQAGGDTEVDLEVPPGTLFSGMESWALAVAELAPDVSVRIPVFQAMESEVTTLTARVVGTEEVTVPAGTFQVYRVELTGGSQPITLYVLQEAPHVAVLQEFAGAPVSLQLKEMR